MVRPDGASKCLRLRDNSDFGLDLGRDDEFQPGERAEQAEAVDVDQIDEHAVSVTTIRTGCETSSTVPSQLHVGAVVVFKSQGRDRLGDLAAPDLDHGRDFNQLGPRDLLPA